MVKSKQLSIIQSWKLFMQSLTMQLNVNWLLTFSKRKLFFYLVERLYAVSGQSGKYPALGFTFNAHPDSFGQLIALWEPNDVRDLSSMNFEKLCFCFVLFVFVEIWWSTWFSRQRRWSFIIRWRNQSKPYWFIWYSQLKKKETRSSSSSNNQQSFFSSI